MKGIAVMAPNRVPIIANLATTGEQGLPGVEATVWNAFFFPKGTPDPIVRRMNKALGDMIARPDIRKKLEELGLEIVPPEQRTPEYLAKMLPVEIERWSKVIRAGSINNAQLVGLAVARGVGGHVGQHHVGATAHHGNQLVRRVVLEKIQLREADAGYFRHLQEIDGDHLAPAVGGADTLGRNLAPAAGRGAEIDHGDALLEKAIFIVDLDQLVGRARAQTVPLGLQHIGIVELALQPEF